MKERKVWLTIILLITATALLVGWRYPQNKANSWDYKIVPVDSVAQGEQVLRDMDGRGWEFIAVQPVRTQAELVPRIQPVQNSSQAERDTKLRKIRQMLDGNGNQAPTVAPLTGPAEQPEAMYFFRRAK